MQYCDVMLQNKVGDIICNFENINNVLFYDHWIFTKYLKEAVVVVTLRNIFLLSPPNKVHCAKQYKSE